MRRLLKTAAPLLTLGIAVTVVTSSGAYGVDEVAGSAALVGTGTISPGVQSSVLLSGTADGNFLINSSADVHHVHFVGGCTFSGVGDTAETVVSGQGHGTLDCTQVLAGHVTFGVPPSGGLANVHVHCNRLDYSRAGAAVALGSGTSGSFCHISVDDGNGHATMGTFFMRGVCLFEPTSGPTVQSFAIECSTAGTPA
jgi:hypothetical protein